MHHVLEYEARHVRRVEAPRESDGVRGRFIVAELDGRDPLGPQQARRRQYAAEVVSVHTIEELAEIVDVPPGATAIRPARLLDST